MADRPELPTFEGDEPNFGNGLFSWLDASIDSTGGAIKAAAPLRIIDAKGDLIAGTAADTAGRLAVGSNGQVLKANSATSTGLEWAAEAGGGSGIPASTVDAKGDLIVGTANDTVDNLAVGTNGYVLKANSATATGLQWAAESGGGGSSAEGIKYLKADYGAIMDGSSHTIASVYTTVAAAVTANPTWGAVDASSLDLLTTDEVDWAALQAAALDVDNWSKLIIDAGTAIINRQWHIPVSLPFDAPDHLCWLGKTVEGINREDSIIQNKSGVNNFRLIHDDCSDLKHSAVWKNLYLRYDTIQTHAAAPNSFAFAMYNDSSFGGFGGPGNRYLSRWENIKIENAARGIATAGTQGAMPWGSVLEDILMVNVQHMAFDFSPGGSGGIPTVTFINPQIHNSTATTSSGSTGACFNLVAVNALILNPDVEYWRNRVFEHQGGSDCIVISGNIEHWIPATAYFGVVYEANGTFAWYNGGIASDNHSVYTRIIAAGSNATVRISDLTVVHNSYVGGGSDFLNTDGTCKVFLNNVRQGTGGTNTVIPAAASETATLDDVYQWNEYFKRAQRTVTTDVTGTMSDDTVFVDSSAAVRTFTLPPAASLPTKRITVSRTGANNVVIDGNASEQINGAATATITSNLGALTLESYGTGWLITNAVGTFT